VLKLAADALDKIRALIDHQLEMCEEMIEAYGLRRAFFSVPDEVLSMVLDYAAIKRLHPDEKWNVMQTVKAATKLSHVCKRFRDIIVLSSSFWNRVNNAMKSPDMVSTCLSRCRCPIAEVTLNTPLFKSMSPLGRLGGYRRNVQFMDNVMKNSDIWGGFILEAVLEDSPSYREFEHGCPEDYAALESVRQQKIPQIDAFLFFLVDTQDTIHVCHQLCSHPISGCSISHIASPTS